MVESLGRIERSILAPLPLSRKRESAENTIAPQYELGALARYTATQRAIHKYTERLDDASSDSRWCERFREPAIQRLMQPAHEDVVRAPVYVTPLCISLSLRVSRWPLCHVRRCVALRCVAFLLSPPVFPCLASPCLALLRCAAAVRWSSSMTPRRFVQLALPACDSRTCRYYFNSTSVARISCRTNRPRLSFACPRIIRMGIHVHKLYPQNRCKRHAGSFKVEAATSLSKALRRATATCSPACSPHPHPFARSCSYEELGNGRTSAPPRVSSLYSICSLPTHAVES